MVHLHSKRLRLYFSFLVFIIMLFVFNGCQSSSSLDELDEARIHAQLDAGVDVSKLAFFHTTFVSIDGVDMSLSQMNKPYFIKTFAVWCANCRRQAVEFETLYGRRDDFSSVSFSVDTNENTRTIVDYVSRNEFSSTFAISPSWMTKGLVDTFGAGITSVPTSPVVFVCKDKALFLNRGHKSSTYLEQFVEACYAY
jgi:hypothetical protein